MYDFYNIVKKNEFGIHPEYGNKSKIDGILTLRRFIYFKEGKPYIDKRDLLAKEPSVEMRTSCEACMAISLIWKYMVVDVVAQHNHRLQPLQYVHMISSNQCIFEFQTSQIVLVGEIGLKSKEFHEYVSNQDSGMTFEPKQSNH